ncbi:hypothetical protein LINPERHAP1_LOCUS8365 [Linum perenne]
MILQSCIKRYVFVFFFFFFYTYIRRKLRSKNLF